MLLKTLRTERQDLTAGARPAGNFRWMICGLLFFATTINYLDRQVLSLLQPTLSEQFNWSNNDYANIASVFQVVYAVSLLFAGKIVDRLGTKKGYAWALIIWSLAAALHALAIPMGRSIASIMSFLGWVPLSASVLGFMVARAILGFGEAGNFPAAIKATAEYFPKKERSFATGIFNSGTNVGAILAPITVPLIAASWGWELAFVIIGAFGFIWLGFWLYLYELPSKQKRLSRAEYEYIHSDEKSEEALTSEQLEEEKKKTGWWKMLGYRQTWVVITGKFMTDGVWWFFLFWLPAFLNAQYQMKGMDIMLPLVVLYSMTMVGSIGGGWFPTYFIQKGYQAYDGRMKAMLVIALFPLVVLLAQPLGDISYWIPVLLIGVAASAHQAWSANMYTTVSDMFPKHTVGFVTGIGGMAGGLGGVLMTKLAGGIFDHYTAMGNISKGYAIMFAICAVAYLLAWRIIKWLVPKYRPVKL